MTSRERFLTTLRGGTVNEPFVWESGIWWSAIERWRRQGMPADVDPYDYLALDRLAYTNIDHGLYPPLAERVVAEETDYQLVETEGGGAFRRSKKLLIPGTQAEPQVAPIRFAVRDRESWEFVRRRLDPTTEVRVQAYEPFLAKRQTQPPGNGGLCASFDPADGLAALLNLMGPTSWLARNAGFEGTAMLLCDDLPLVEEIYDHYTGFLSRQLERVLAERVPDMLVIGESSAASSSGPFMSPRMYSDVAAPRLARLVGLARDAGVEFVFVHCAGEISNLAPIWQDVGVNGLMPIEVHTDPAALCRDYPDTALIGGISRWQLEGTAAALERHVREMTRLLWNHGRAIPSADAHYPISDRVSLDNMRLYIELLKAKA